MSAPEESPEADGEEAAEPRQMSERTAKAILVVIAVGAMWGVVAVAPWVAYVVVGVLGTLGWQKARDWIAGRRDGREDEAPAEEVDIVGVLQSLAKGGRHVLLTELKTALGVADTKAVRALLDGCLIPVRAGVRTQAGNGPGVHHDDIPPVAGGSPAGRCLCSSGANANANNEAEEGAGEGLRVVPLGTEGKIIYDPKDTVRHHKVRSRWGHSGNGAS